MIVWDAVWTACHANQCDHIFSSVATHACCQFNVDRKVGYKFYYLDTTSISVHGEYMESTKMEWVL